MNARVKITDEMVAAAVATIARHAERDGVLVSRHTLGEDEWRKLNDAVRDALKDAAAVAAPHGRGGPPLGWLGRKTLDGYNG
jgi:malic enzyme